MHNLSHHALDVSLALGVVQSTELGNTLAKMGVGLEHSTLSTLSLTYTRGENRSCQRQQQIASPRSHCIHKRTSNNTTHE